MSPRVLPWGSSQRGFGCHRYRRQAASSRWTDVVSICPVQCTSCNGDYVVCLAAIMKLVPSDAPALFAWSMSSHSLWV